MPDMSGRQLADRALGKRPSLKVLYTAGYTRDAIVHNGMLDPGTNLLTKPFSIEELAAKFGRSSMRGRKRVSQPPRLEVFQ
jgi:CheY-like chemotaxis protein